MYLFITLILMIESIHMCINRCWFVCWSLMTDHHENLYKYVDFHDEDLRGVLES